MEEHDRIADAKRDQIFHENVEDIVPAAPAHVRLEKKPVFRAFKPVKHYVSGIWRATVIAVPALDGRYILIY